MKATKNHTYTTHTFDVEDGPLEETTPGRLTHGKFKVEYMAVTYHDGVLFSVYLKGQRLTVKGGLGKTPAARTYYTSGYPEWVKEYITG